jgi:hypothetical protein
MLDQLASIMKASGSKKPAIIEQTAWHDPLGYTIEQRRAIARNPEHFQKLDMIPERMMYQKGLRNQYDKRLAQLQDIENYLDDEADKLEELRDEYGNGWDGYDYDLMDAQKRWNQAHYELEDWERSGIQKLQTETPRYRRYQDAMMQRAENARLGRINAAVMNLARQGYTMPEIREILRGGR